MAHVFVTGGSLDHHTHGLLLRSGHLLTFAPLGLDRFSIDELSRAVLLTKINNTGVVRRAGATARNSSLSWVAWNLNDCTDIALAAYEAGASAVLPSTFSASAFDGIVHTVINGTGTAGAGLREPEQHSYQPGDRIVLTADTVLWVRKGVIALTELYEDGTECLNGFCAPGQVVIDSGDPTVQHIAHTAVVVAVQPWSRAVRQPGFATLLHERLREAQAWVNSRGHHHVDARLLATLNLLARKFGAEDSAGTLIDLHLTHAQLAAATASTRATVTRRLAALRRRGLLTTVTTEHGIRLVLTNPDR